MNKFFGLFSVILLCLIIAACGFRPLYGTAGGVNKDRLERVAIGTIPEREGQILRNELLDLFSSDPDKASQYRLNVASVNITSTGIGIDRTSEAETRVQLLVTAPYSLTRLSDKKIVHRGEARSFVAYNILESQFETITARDDAEHRALSQLAQAIMRETALALQP